MREQNEMLDKEHESEVKTHNPLEQERSDRAQSDWVTKAKEAREKLTTLRNCYNRYESNRAAKKTELREKLTFHFNNGLKSDR